MVVILPDDCYGSWLKADASQSGQFLRPFPAELMQASAPRVGKGLF